MSESKSRYQCPACGRAILNRKTDKCLYCGAILPAELLLSEEAIAELNRQQQQLEERNRQNTSRPAGDNATSNWDIGDAIDVTDIAADISDIGDLLD